MSKVTDPEATCADSDSAACNGHGLSTDEPAEWISGAHWADELGVDPDGGIGDVLGADAWKAVRRFSRRFDIGLSHFGADGMAFADFDALPREIWHTASPKVEITRAQATAFAEDMLKEDPHQIGERWKRERAQRLREKDRTDRALKAVSILAATEYTFDAVESAAGPEIAARARELVDRANRRAWSTPKPHSHPEHEHLICAAELHDKLGVSVATIATMTAATEQERDSALGELDVARIRHREDAIQRARAGDVPALDLTAEALSVSGLSTLEPVSPLIEGFLYRGQLGELIGHPGIGKTFAALGMALSVASGSRWCGHGVPEAMPVVYVAAEGASGIYTRLLAWCRVNGVDPARLEGKFLVVPRAVQMGDDDHMAQVVKVVRQIGAGLVVFDTRARCTVGLEENSATEQGKAIKRADELNQQTGAAVLVVHHTSAHADRGRGSTAWDGALYSSLLMTRTSKGVQIECAKHKDAPSGCTHSFKLDNHVVAPAMMPNADAGQRSTMVLVGVDPMVFEADDLTETEEKIVELIAELGGTIGLSRTEIKGFAAERKISKTSTYRAINALAGRERLVNVGTKSAAKFVVPTTLETAADGVDSGGSPPACPGS